MNRIFIIRQVDGFQFVAQAEASPAGDSWSVNVWEIAYRALPRYREWSEQVGLNNHATTVNTSHAPTSSRLIWEELEDMLATALLNAKGREALNAGPYSDQQSKGPGS